jgi:hypothetical protein
MHNSCFAQWLGLGQVLENPVGFSNICFIFVMFSLESQATDAKQQNVRHKLKKK